jgi:hypothetical protein
MARNRIIYASQSVWANGEVLHRVQSLGTTTTFTSEDVFEFGHLDIIDVVDDVPKVAVTLNTNDFGDVRTLAILAQVPSAKAVMDATANSTTGNLVSGGTYLHGVCLADFAITCGNLPGVTIWAPVQSECDLGTLANNIDQTLFLDKVFVNSLEFGYTTGANATENFAAETDNKMWLLNDGAFVNYQKLALSGGESTWTIASGVTIPKLSTGNLGFLRKTDAGEPAVSFYDASNSTKTNYAIKATNAVDYSAVTDFGFDSTLLDGALIGPYTLTIPTALTALLASGDIFEVIYAANGYFGGNTYFIPASTVSGTSNGDIGAIRQGQVEVSIIDSGVEAAAWRLTGCTITSDLTREPLAELGHLAPYDRPLKMPIPITVKVDSTAGDLENWAKFAGKLDLYEGMTLDDLKLADLMNKDDLILMIKVYEQTDEEAGGTAAARKVLTDSICGNEYFVDGTKAYYAATVQTPPQREYALKTLVVKNLKITDEGMTLNVGANGTQTFGFRSTNDLYAVKGDLSAAKAASLMRNSSM